MELCQSQNARPPHGTLVLECEGVHRLDVSQDIICMISPVLADIVAVMLQDLSKDTKRADTQERGCLKVHDTTVEQWQLLITQMHPASDRRCTLQEISAVLPVAHKYNMDVVLSRLDGCLVDLLSRSFCLDPSSDKYVFTWLRLSDEMQLSKLNKTCIAVLGNRSIPGFSALAHSGRLDFELKGLRQETLVTIAIAMTQRYNLCDCGAWCACIRRCLPGRSKCHKCMQRRINRGGCGGRLSP